jgi:hypothetical protein
MTRFVDDDPPIKTHPASKEYRDNWDRIFGEKEPESEKGPDEVEMKFTISRPPRVDGCPSNECAIRNVCTGSAGCPHFGK